MQVIAQPAFSGNVDYLEAVFPDVREQAETILRASAKSNQVAEVQQQLLEVW